MPLVSGSIITSLKTLGKHLVDLVPENYRQKNSKWQKRGEKLQTIAATLEQNNCEETQAQAKTLFNRISTKFKSLSWKIAPSSSDLVNRQIESLQNDFNAMKFPGLSKNLKTFTVSEDLLNDPQAFLTTLKAIYKEVSYKSKVNVGPFTYRVFDLLAYCEANLPLQELTTTVRFSLQEGEVRELSTATARQLIGISSDQVVPETFDLSYVDLPTWTLVSGSLDGPRIDSHTVNYLDDDQRQRLERFLRNYRSDLLPKFESAVQEWGPGCWLNISRDSFSLPADQYRIEMTELLSKYETDTIILRLDNASDYRVYTYQRIYYKLSKEDFSKLIQSNDPTLKHDRENQVICTFSNSQQASISRLEARILLRKGLTDDLPDNLDLSELNEAYLPYLLRIMSAKNPLSVLNWEHGDELHYDQYLMLLNFLEKHHPQMSIDLKEKVKERRWRRSFSYISVKVLPAEFKQVVQLVLENFPSTCLEMPVKLPGSKSYFPRTLGNDLLKYIAKSDVFFNPSLLVNQPTALLSDGLEHTIPYEFCSYLRPECIQKDGTLDLPDLTSVSPTTLRNAVYFAGKYSTLDPDYWNWSPKDMFSGTPLQQREDAVRFLQQFSPNSPCTAAAQRYLVNLDVASISVENWDELQEELKPYMQVPEKYIQIGGDSGPKYIRAALQTFAQEKQIPYAFPSRAFTILFSDGTLSNIDATWLNAFWDHLKASVDPEKLETFGTAEAPIEVNFAMAPELFQQVQTYLSYPIPNRFTVAALLQIQTFLKAHNAPCQEIETYLTTTQIIMVQIEPKDSDIYQSIKDQFKAAPKAKIFYTPGMEGHAYTKEDLEVLNSYSRISEPAFRLTVRDPSYDQIQIPLAKFNAITKKDEIRRIEQANEIAKLLTERAEKAAPPPLERRSYRKVAYVITGVVLGALALFVASRTNVGQASFRAMVNWRLVRSITTSGIWSSVMNRGAFLFSPFKAALRALKIS